MVLKITVRYSLNIKDLITLLTTVKKKALMDLWVAASRITSTPNITQVQTPVSLKTLVRLELHKKSIFL